jgi:hypothetical protein
MTRPRLPAAKKRSSSVCFRISEAEHAQLAAQAERLSCSVNQLARRLTLTRAERVTFRVAATSDPALLKHLHRIGHNLNQLVKNAHIFGRVDPKVGELAERIGRLIDEAEQANGGSQ